MKKYIDQWERVQRWFRIFEDIAYGKSHSFTTEQSLDMVLSFFINCYHLKDWIKNDDECNVDSETVEDFVKAHSELKLCGKISNGAKHLYFKGKFKGNEPAFPRKDIDLRIDESGVTIAIRFFVEDQSEEYDAFQIARRSVELWKDFLQSKNLMD